jgi:hypothetical protein
MRLQEYNPFDEDSQLSLTELVALARVEPVELRGQVIDKLSKDRTMSVKRAVVQSLVGHRVGPATEEKSFVRISKLLCDRLRKKAKESDTSVEGLIEVLLDNCGDVLVQA